MNKKWDMVSFAFRWPHQGILIGYEIWEPSEEVNYYAFKLHLMLITISYEFGDGDSPYA
jgi:hypothetical protein